MSSYSRTDILNAAQAAGPSTLLAVTRVLLVLDRRAGSVVEKAKSDADELPRKTA